MILDYFMGKGSIMKTAIKSITLPLLVFFSGFIKLESKEWQVRQSSDISGQEKKALIKRFPLIKVTIEKLTGQSLDQNYIPEVGIVCSGGGCRSAIASLGFINGIKEIIDTCSHISTLSGSTWMLGALLSYDKSLKEFTDNFQKRLERGVNVKDFEMKKIFWALWNKWWTNNQKISITDIYGCILAHLFLKDQKQILSSAGQNVLMGSTPIPILTAGIDNKSPREYCEVSPFECGSINFLKAWVNTIAAGKIFDDGDSDDQAHEQKLDFWLACCGSAYAFGLSDAIKYILDWIRGWWPFENNQDINCETKKLFLTTLDTIEQDLNTIKKSINTKNDTSGYIAGRINNFMKNIPDTPLTNDTYITLVDAAICLPNLPFSPLLHRNNKKGLDLYLVCDASGGKKSDVIKLLEKYAQEKKLKLPMFDYKKIDTNQICLFYDEKDPEVPVIAYFPNTIDTPTLKFQYSKQEFALLHDTMKLRAKKSHDLIITAIKIAIENCKKKTSNWCSIL